MILARFPDFEALRQAQAAVAAAPGTRTEIYVPHEPPEDAPASEVSWIPLAILLGGLAGTIGFFLLQAYAEVVAYVMNIGGRPNFSWPAYVPNAIEVGILAAIATGFVCFFIAAGLPRLFHPMDRFQAAREGSRSAYLLLAESDDPARLRAAVEATRPLRLEEMA